MFRRIAVVNRGEAAMRLINAVRELNAEGGEPIETVALYTDGERTATFVREADLAYPLGPASNRPYVDHAVLERALRETTADAAWVGWGFVAEDPAFAELCERVGVTFIGPAPDAMRQLGDKIASKLMAESVGVPVAPWSGGPVESLEAALAAADKIGYPLMLKAAAGGGGRGIRVIRQAEDLEEAYDRTRDEAARAFGNGVVYLEKLVTGARHVEVQVIADGQGTAWALGVRDCSVQRRNQKVIEESSSPVLNTEQVEALKGAAERLALAVDYRGAGTVEFLYRPADAVFAFLEVNTRLQVEHPITEVTTAVDLVKLQLRVAAGAKLEGEKPTESGHAVEARLNAEDPDRDFAPAPGRIALFDLPTGPGVRVDTGVSEGDTIPAEFDSMIAKIIAYGRTRDEALARLRRAVAATTVIIEGGVTNKSFLLDLLAQPEVIDGSADTGWIDRVRGEGRLVSHRHSGIGLVAAAIEGYKEAEQVERLRLLSTAHGGRPQVQHEVGRAIDLTLRGVAYRVTVAQIGPKRFRVGVANGHEPQVVYGELDRLGPYTSRLVVGDRSFRLVTATHGPVHLVEVDGVTHRVSRDEGGVLRSPAPALVVATPVAPGTEVEAGAPVLVLESMKMETVLYAPFRAIVRELLVSTGSQVETSAPLVRLEPVAEGEAEEVAPALAGVDLELPTENGQRSAAERAARGLDDLRSMLLGFDLDPRDEGKVLTGYLAARAELAAVGGAPMAAEIELLQVFADFAELSRNRPVGEDVSTENQVHSPREHFHTYLQSLDPDRGGLPEEFRGRLARVLGHYGVTDLERGVELEGAVFRIFLAQQRSTPDVLLVTSLLQAWSTEPRPEPPLEVRVHDVLDRLVLATQLRFPIVGDLARSVRFRWYDQPLVDEARAEVLAGVGPELEALAASLDGPERQQRIEALAAIPEKIVRFLAAHIEHGWDEREPMLEVLIRRHYREYELRDLGETAVDGRPFATADYSLDDQPTHLVSTVGTVAELVDPAGGLAHALAAQIDAGPAGHEAVVDLYLFGPDVPEDGQQASDTVRELIARLPSARRVRRLTVAIARGNGREVEYFTYRPEGDTFVEDDNVRGLHPMVAQRLNLWRLGDFRLTRLEAPEDVLLYHCVARENDADRRLVALAQVRQFSATRDEKGHVTSLPHVERAISNCVEAIRRARSARGAAGARLDLNHIWLHVWPVVDVQVDELAALQRNIAPLTAGAGVEEVLAEGRVRGSDGTIAPVVAPVLVPVRNGRCHLGRAAGGGAAQAARRLRPERAALAAPQHGLPVRDERPDRRPARVGRRVRPGRQGRAGARRSPAWVEQGGPDRRCGQHAAVTLSGRHQAGAAQRRPDQGARRVGRRGVHAGDRGARPRRAAAGAGGVVRVVRRCADLDGLRHGEHGLDREGAEADRRVHPERRRDQRHRGRHQRRRPAVLERRGDDAHAHQGHPGDDAGQRDGADRQAVAGLLRWCLGGGQLRHRRLRPGDGSERPGSVLGARSQAGLGHPDGALRPHVRGAGGVRSAAGRHDGPGGSGRAPRIHTRRRAADFRTVGDIFSTSTNPDRKKAFDIRTVMRAVSDEDHPVLERWAGMADAETAVVQDARLGGYPVCLLGIESKSVPRRGFPPADGPDTYTSGTLFPRSSKKVARAINAASGNRPLVVLANLSGFDGSPDSMRNLQLEYGAEIGRAIVNFSGPIVFCVVSRYHGGAFVVFSKALNPRLTVLAVEGSFASVIGGAPAAAVVFAREVRCAGRRPTRGSPAGGAGGEGGRRGTGARWRRSWRRCGPPSGRRSSARWRRSSTGCTASNAPSRSVRSTP